MSSHGGGPNMNNGVGELSSSQPGSFFMKLAPSPGYSIQQPQQPQQSDILGGMMSSVRKELPCVNQQDTP